MMIKYRAAQNEGSIFRAIFVYIIHSLLFARPRLTRTIALPASRHRALHLLLRNTLNNKLDNGRAVAIWLCLSGPALFFDLVLISCHAATATPASFTASHEVQVQETRRFTST